MPHIYLNYELQVLSTNQSFKPERTVHTLQDTALSEDRICTLTRPAFSDTLLV